MPMYKVTYIYRMGANGWTETFYRSANSHYEAPFSGATEQRLLEIRGPGTVLQAIRVSDVAATRSSIIIEKNRRITPEVGTDQEVVSVAALTRFNTAALNRRHVWFRGLADFEVRTSSEGQSMPEESLLTDLNYIIGRLRTGSDQIYLRRLQGVDVNPWKVVDQLSSGGEGGEHTIIHTVAPHGFSGPSRVYFRGYNRSAFPGLRGQFVALPITENTFRIPLRWPHLASYVAYPAMEYRVVAYTYDAITDGQFVRFTSRQTGRPITQSRGRRPGVSYRR